MMKQEPQSKQNSKNPENHRLNKQARVYNMRCPSCAKLYRVQAEAISSSSPHFDCQVCQTSFTFDYPPRHPHSIQTRVLKVAGRGPAFSSASNLDFNENHFKECPKCHHINPKNVDECILCHVLFARVDGLPMEAKSTAFPSLMKMWHELLSDYENLTKHVAFVNRCEDLQAIPFALKKYRSLKAAQPHDELTDKMLHQVVLKSLGVTAGRMAEASRLNFVMSKVNWPRVLKIAPLAISLMMLLVGAASHPLRNLVGIGAALFVLIVGLRLFKSGELRSEDFF